MAHECAIVVNSNGVLALSSGFLYGHRSHVAAELNAHLRENIDREFGKVQSRKANRDGT